MQTFLPSPTFATCAQLLDSRRLAKQLVEGRQLWDIIHHPETSRATPAQRNHPARWYFPPERARNFASYLLTMYQEWRIRQPGSDPSHKSIHEIYHELLACLPDRHTRDSTFWHPFAAAIADSHLHALWCKDKLYYRAARGFVDLYQLPDFINYIWLTADGEPYTGQLSRPKSVRRFNPADSTMLHQQWITDTKRRYLTSRPRTTPLPIVRPPISHTLND